MKILLTGSTGFLGKYLYRNISQKFQVFTLCRTRTCDFLCDLTHCIPNFNQDFDIIIHAAGKAHTIPKSDIEKKSFYDINVIGTNNLLKGLSQSVPKQFVFVSSVSVYGLIEGENINEESPLLAQDPYGKSKIESEDIVKKWCYKHNVICTILRLPLIIGVNPPGNLGSMIHGIKKGYYFNIAGGNAKKSMVLASDIAKFILNAAEIGGTFNLTDGMDPTFNELSKCISQNLKKSIVPNIPFIIANVLAKIGDLLGNHFPINSCKLSKITSTLTFDDSKARLAFGWNPTPILEGFKLNENVE